MKKILIKDVNCSLKFNEGLLTEANLFVLDAKKMSDLLIRQHYWKQFNSLSTLIVFPGNGASIVKKFIKQSDCRWLNNWVFQKGIFAKRVWNPGEEPRVFVDHVFPGRFALGIKDVIIVDDVVSTGKTINKIKEKNQPFIPGAKWHAVSWIAQKAANFKRFDSTLFLETVGERNRKTSINSISTLLKEPQIAESFARRNLGRRAAEFLNLLQKT